MKIEPGSDGSEYRRTITETERRVLVDALTNLSLDAAKGAAESPDHDGRACPSAEVCGDYLSAADTASSMARSLKDGY